MQLRNKMIVFSVVSHGQATLVNNLFSSIEKYFSGFHFKVLLTINIPEDDAYARSRGFDLTVIKNSTPLGFGENHNNAFSKCNCHYFVVLNPDVVFIDANLFKFVDDLFISSDVCLVGPTVLNKEGQLEFSARKFPSLVNLLLKLLRGPQTNYSFPNGARTISVDWVGGMCMIFRSTAYKIVNGFDSLRFFMYYEDVDVCKRLSAIDLKILYTKEIVVIHDARRDSHKNLKYFLWHIKSCLRFLFNV